MNLPIVKADILFHFGTLNAKDRGNQMGESYEGHLLSVSNCPFAWEEIARLGGNPLHSLEANGSLLMLDLHRVMDDPELKLTIQDWGIAEGLCESAELWKAWNTDEEGSWRYSTYSTEDQAWMECDEGEESRDNGEPLVEQFTAMVGTKKLADMVKIRDLSTDSSSLEFVAILWAEKHYPQLHGAWWDETLDVAAYSAPRGGIFPAKIPEINFQKINRKTIDDDLYPIKFDMLGPTRKMTP